MVQSLCNSDCQQVMTNAFNTMGSQPNSQFSSALNLLCVQNQNTGSLCLPALQQLGLLAPASSSTSPQLPGQGAPLTTQSIETMCTPCAMQQLQMQAKWLQPNPAALQTYGADATDTLLKTICTPAAPTMGQPPGKNVAYLYGFYVRKLTIFVCVLNSQ